MLEIILKNGRILDPKSQTDASGDILINEGIISKIGQDLSGLSSNPTIIDLQGQWAMPGFVDTQVTFPEPGREDVETIQEGAQRAIQGGFAAVCMLPNTSPPIDNQALVKFILAEGNASPIHIFPIGAVFMGDAQDRLSEMYELKKVGCVSFANGRAPILNSLTMRRALEYTRMVGSTLYAFPDDPNLSNNGFANEGYVATELGFRAAPNESEEIAISRDILLTRLTQGSIHIGPITTKGSSDLIKRAKKEKLNLTAFTASHYLKLTDGIFYDLLGSAKVFPPFRSEEDRQAIIQACQNGTIDILVSDHSPHPPFEVEQEIDRAPFGISTLETAVAVAVEVLIHEAGLSPMIIPQLFSWNPCKRFNLPLGYLQEGTEANITCMDPNKKMEITEKIFSGRSKNNPFIGQMLRGFPSTLIAKGKLVLKDGSLVENL